MTSFNQAKILIVDDNMQQIAPLIDSLSQHNAIPLIAQSGEDALELIQENRPDLILMDIILPYGLNGFQTCKKIKSNMQHKDIPIIFFSSLKSISDKMNAFESGGVDYIEKPLEIKEVLIRVRTHLKIKHLQDLLVQKNEDLKAAKDQADLANQYKSTFLANMSHEIRTPMNSIIIANDLLSETNLSTSQSEYVEILKSSSNHLRTIINDILDLSLIESGKLRLIDENFDLYQLIDDVKRMFLYPIKKKGLAFSCSRADHVIQFFEGDADRIRQILINLIGNAIKFTKTGEIRLNVQHDQTDPDSDIQNIKFEVHDTGIGIAKEQLAAIFEDYIQAGNTIRRQFGGTGLGLSICKKLVDLMGGYISAESEESKGSIFSFTLPLKPCPNIKQQSKSVTENRHGFNILLVDDVPINRKSAGLLLQRMGHKVMMAKNGINAIETLKSNTFDMIFMDIEMPEMDGMTATQLIRQGKAGKKAQSTPVIAMTAHAMARIKKECFDVGMNHFISKPINKKELTELFEKFTSSANIHESFRSSGQTHPPDTRKDLNFLGLINAFDGDKEGAHEIIEHALFDFDKYIDQLRQAYESTDYDNLKNVSHILKGLTANIHANMSNECAKKLEDAAKRKDDAQITDAYQLFMSQSQRLKIEMKDVINPNKNI